MMNIRTPEYQILKKMQKSIYYENVVKLNRVKKIKLMEVFISLARNMWEEGMEIDLSKLLDLVYETITGKYEIFRLRLSLGLNNSLNDDKSNIFNYLVELSKETEVKEYITGKDIMYINGFNIKKIIKFLDNSKKTSSQKPQLKIHLKEKLKKQKVEITTNIYSLNPYYKRKKQGYLLDVDEKNHSLPKEYYYVEKDRMIELRKKIIEISAKDGSFKTNLLSKGNKVKGINSTKDIENFSDFIGSSISYAKKDKKLFVKQLLEKQIYKFDKPNNIQDKKRHQFNIFLENTRNSQRLYNETKNKYIYLFKVLSTMIVSDLTYIFKDIKNWNIDVSLNMLPVTRENKDENTILLDVERIANKLEDFIDFNDFSSVYSLIKAREDKLLFNTINYGKKITEGLFYSKEALEKKKMGLSQRRQRKMLGLNFNLFIFIVKDKIEKESKLKELNELNESNELKYIIFFMETSEHELGLYRLAKKSIKIKEYTKLKTGFREIRVELLREITRDFNGKK